ncbi:Uncharacterised protein g10353 [Pycnogonum litorale]
MKLLWIICLIVAPSIGSAVTDIVQSDDETETLSIDDAVEADRSFKSNNNFNKGEDGEHLTNRISDNYQYEDEYYKEKPAAGGYSGSDLYSNKAGYGYSGGGGGGGGGGGHSGGSSVGGGNSLLQMLTSLGVLLSLLLAGLALGAAMFGPFNNGMTGTIPTVPVPPMGIGRKSRTDDDASQPGMVIQHKVTAKTRAILFDSLERILHKYEIKDKQCRQRFVCEMYNDLYSADQDLADRMKDLDYNVRSFETKDESQLIKAALNGACGKNCTSTYDGCEENMKEKLKRVRNDMAN